MGTFIDLTGKTFNNLTVLYRLQNKDNRAMWKCRCNLCGKECEVSGQRLRNGKAISCGCARHKNNARDLVGKKFNHLTVIKRLENDKSNRAMWLCQCDCENKTLVEVSGKHLKNGNTKSCGCLRKQKHYIDLTGQKFGYLEVLELDHIEKKKVFWKCKCTNCGNITIVNGSDMKMGKILSCGCINISQKGSADENIIRNFMEVLMAKRIDMIGKRFGHLVVEKLDSNRNGQLYWCCRCDCGKDNVIVRGSHLRNGYIVSCGHYNKEVVSQKEDLVGKKFGRLTVVEFSHDNYWKCVCDCGNENFVVVSRNNLTSGNTISCGCKQKEIASEIGKNRKGNYKNLSGQKFGKLTAKEIVDVIDGTPLWRCECDCDEHNIIDVRRDYLVDGIVKSCGCLRGTRAEDLTGKKFGKLIPISYYRKNDRTYWKCKCECGNEHEVERTHLINGSVKSCGCQDIAHVGSSAENEIKSYISDYVYTEKARKILDGKEIDIYIPSLKLGIEYNDSACHASKNSAFSDKPKLYHQQKFLLAKENGIHLISIFDVDWHNNKDKIKMYLSSLVLPQKKIFARKCEIRKVGNNVACDFVDKYHLQGANKAAMKINYGIYYDDKLFAVMSFGKLRLSKTDEGQYELHRYCVKDGYTIVGGASKLLKYFEKDYSPLYIRSYSDNDYFLGGIYEILGFENKGQSTPRYYWYLNGNEIKREQCMLKRLKESYPELLQEAYDVCASNKEDYVMIKLGACKVYRSGNTKWEKYAQRTNANAHQ